MRRPGCAEHATDLVGAERRWGGTIQSPQTYARLPSLSISSAPRLLIQNVTHSDVQAVQIYSQNSDGAAVEDTSVRQKRHGDLREQKETTSLFSLIHRPSLLPDVPSTQSLHLTESYAR